MLCVYKCSLCMCLCCIMLCKIKHCAFENILCFFFLFFTVWLWKTLISRKTQKKMKKDQKIRILCRLRVFCFMCMRCIFLASCGVRKHKGLCCAKKQENRQLVNETLLASYCSGVEWEKRVYLTAATCWKNQWKDRVLLETFFFFSSLKKFYF